MTSTVKVTTDEAKQQKLVNSPCYKDYKHKGMSNTMLFYPFSLRLLVYTLVISFCAIKQTTIVVNSR